LIFSVLDSGAASQVGKYSFVNLLQEQIPGVREEKLISKMP